MTRLLLLFLVPLWAQAVSFTLTCSDCPASIVGRSTFNLAVNYAPAIGDPPISAAQIRVAMPIDVASFRFSAGSIVTKAGKVISQAGSVVLASGLNSTSMSAAGPLFQIAVTMKPALTLSTEVFTLPVAIASSMSGNKVSVIATGLALHATVIAGVNRRKFDTARAWVPPSPFTLMSPVISRFNVWDAIILGYRNSEAAAHRAFSAGFRGLSSIPAGRISAVRS